MYVGTHVWSVVRDADVGACVVYLERRGVETRVSESGVLHF